MADPSLEDMMMALTRAHGAGNAGDAASIAQMIQQSYPEEAAHMLAATPQPGEGGRPPNPGMAAMAAFQPPYVRSTIPLTPQVSFPPGFGQAPDQNESPPPSVNALNGIGGGGGPAASGNYAQRIGSDISDFAGAALRNFVGALPHGNEAAAAFGAGARNIAAAAGLTTPTTYGDVLANAQGGQQQAAQNSPLGAAVGTIAGNVATMALGSAGASGVLGLAGRSAIPLVAPAARAAQGAAAYLGARPLLGGAAAGAAGGAVEGAVNQIEGKGSLFDTGAQIALGAAGGAVIGKGADLAVAKLVPAAARGWYLLAQKLGSLTAGGKIDAMNIDAATSAGLKMGLDPDDLQAEYARVFQQTGQRPPIATIIQGAAQAKVAALAEKSPDLASPLSTAAKDWTAQGPTRVPGLIDNAVSSTVHPFSPTDKSGVQSIASLENARDATMKEAMDPIRGNMIQLTPDDSKTLQTAYSVVRDRFNVLPAPDETEGVLARVGDAIKGLGNQAPSGALALSDIDQLRQAVSDSAPGYETDKLAYKAGQALAKKVAGIGGRDPDYAPAVAQYGNHQAYIEGFKDGLPGTALADISGSGRTLAQPTGPAYQQGHASGVISGLASKAGASENGAQSVLQTLAQNNALRKTIVSAYGRPIADRLANVGSQLSQATATLGHVAPGAPVAAPESNVGEHVGRAALGMAVHSHFGFLHNAYYAIADAMHGSIPPNVAVKLGDMLVSTNPAVQNQAIAAMRARGAADADIARIRAYVAGIGGGKTAGYAMPGQ